MGGDVVIGPEAERVAPPKLCNDGYMPKAGVVIGNHGELYGTTYQGGISNNGIVFELMPPPMPGGAWTESIIYNFTGQNGDGANPVAGLVLDNSGNLYGTTTYGGIAGYGTAFKLTPPTAPGGAWAETQLTILSNPFQGTTPVGGVVFGLNGNLYGAMEWGGAPSCIGSTGVGCGTIFKLQP